MNDMNEELEKIVEDDEEPLFDNSLNAFDKTEQDFEEGIKKLPLAEYHLSRRAVEKMGMIGDETYASAVSRFGEQNLFSKIKRFNLSCLSPTDLVAYNFLFGYKSGAEDIHAGDGILHKYVVTPDEMKNFYSQIEFVGTIGPYEPLPGEIIPEAHLDGEQEHKAMNNILNGNSVPSFSNMYLNGL